VNILVTFALEPEFSPWRRAGFRKRPDARLNLYEREGGALRVLLTGVGEANARRAVAAALDAFRPEACISSGFAGGLRPQHRAGTLLAARAVARLEQPGELATDSALLALACGLGARETVFLTAAREIISAEEKRRLGSLADAVEMESYGVLAEAAARGIPAAAVRAVCDPVEMNLPSGLARVVDDQGNLRKAALAKKLLTGLSDWPALAALGRDSSRAAAGLAEFLGRFVAALVERSPGSPRVEATVA
jgi:adenosylhomocysteine nucleosidase